MKYNKALLRKIYSLALLNFRRARRYDSQQTFPPRVVPVQ